MFLGPSSSSTISGNPCPRFNHFRPRAIPHKTERTLSRFEFLLRDHGLLGAEEQSPEGETRSGQLLWLFSHIPSWREVPATQCQSLTVLVQLISSTEIPVQLGDVINAIEVSEYSIG